MSDFSETKQLAKDKQMAERLNLTLEEYHKTLKDKVKNVKEVNTVEESMKLQNFYFLPSYKKILWDHFKSKGLKWGQGVRTVLIQYMIDNALIK